MKTRKKYTHIHKTKQIKTKQNQTEPNKIQKMLHGINTGIECVRVKIDRITVPKFFLKPSKSMKS